MSRTPTPLPPRTETGRRPRESSPESAANAQLLGELLPRAREGDAIAQADLVRLYQRRIAAYVRTLLPDPAEVEDVVQITFIKMFRRFTLLRELPSFEPWLFTLARNSAFDQVRRRRRRPVAVSDDISLGQIPDATNAGVMAEITEVVDLVTAKLGRKDQEILAVILRGGDYQTAAVRAGVTRGAVKARLNRLRKRLRVQFAIGFEDGSSARPPARAVERNRAAA